MFAVVAGKPRIRIFLNQEEEHLKRGDDFISPQPVFSWKDEFWGFYDPDEGRYSRMVAVKLQVDVTGNPVDARVDASKSMAGRGYTKSILDRIHTLNFIPAFYRGRPVASSTTWNIAYRGYGRGDRWMPE